MWRPGEGGQGGTRKDKLTTRKIQKVMVPRRVYGVVKKSDGFTSAGFPAQRVKVRNRFPVYQSLDKAETEVNKLRGL